MASHKRVLNITNGSYRKFRAAEKAVESCSASWVEYGVSIRNLNVLESTAARNDQAKLREPLPYAEIAGCKYEPCPAGILATQRESALIRDAHMFAAGL